MPKPAKQLKTAATEETTAPKLEVIEGGKTETPEQEPATPETLTTKVPEGFFNKLWEQMQKKLAPEATQTGELRFSVFQKMMRPFGGKAFWEQTVANLENPKAQEKTIEDIIKRGLDRAQEEKKRLSAEIATTTTQIQTAAERIGAKAPETIPGMSDLEAELEALDITFGNFSQTIPDKAPQGTIGTELGYQHPTRDIADMSDLEKSLTIKNQQATEEIQNLQQEVEEYIKSGKIDAARQVFKTDKKDIFNKFAIYLRKEDQESLDAIDAKIFKLETLKTLKSPKNKLEKNYLSAEHQSIMIKTEKHIKQMLAENSSPEEISAYFSEQINKIAQESTKIAKGDNSLADKISAQAALWIHKIHQIMDEQTSSKKTSVPKKQTAIETETPTPPASESVPTTSTETTEEPRVLGELRHDLENLRTRIDTVIKARRPELAHEDLKYFEDDVLGDPSIIRQLDSKTLREFHKQLRQYETDLNEAAAKISSAERLTTLNQLLGNIENAFNKLGADKSEAEKQQDFDRLITNSFEVQSLLNNIPAGRRQAAEAKIAKIKSLIQTKAAKPKTEKKEPVIMDKRISKTPDGKYMAQIPSTFMETPAGKWIPAGLRPKEFDRLSDAEKELAAADAQEALYNNEAPLSPSVSTSAIPPEAEAAVQEKITADTKENQAESGEPINESEELPDEELLEFKEKPLSERPEVKALFKQAYKIKKLTANGDVLQALSVIDKQFGPVFQQIQLSSKYNLAHKRSAEVFLQKLLIEISKKTGETQNEISTLFSEAKNSIKKNNSAVAEEQIFEAVALSEQIYSADTPQGKDILDRIKKQAEELKKQLAEKKETSKESPPKSAKPEAKENKDKNIEGEKKENLEKTQEFLKTALDTLEKEWKALITPIYAEAFGVDLNENQAVYDQIMNKKPGYKKGLKDALKHLSDEFKKPGSDIFKLLSTPTASEFNLQIRMNAGGAGMGIDSPEAVTKYLKQITKEGDTTDAENGLSRNFNWALKTLFQKLKPILLEKTKETDKTKKNKPAGSPKK
ncbi:hypothetical protein COT97_05115 [Candidatus Falkowbacteria bacterium CG10_big_fil_rev_8_21_14_0_10_39_11]|uniref:Uncharacterized protein n=1 Tax=Candidatus Falkowbacteria bacterium CG10_big_fil_rev_8_21_14_0_10_39_11 TaxID=1974565 RepID=A0A2H0V3P7_9BACT|nr:MAG: hypothetical protein COT97_05115 [Candidatus Falkowbacteria bacterium CG10_big_fil_rev_8_21_14_0_10_39_11]